METFRASGMIPRKAEAVFLLHYEELLQRRLGMYQYTVSIRPQQLVGKLRVEVNILENSGINSLEVLPLQNSRSKGNGEKTGEQDSVEVLACGRERGDLKGRSYVFNAQPCFSIA